MVKLIWESPKNRWPQVQVIHSLWLYRITVPEQEIRSRTIFRGISQYWTANAAASSIKCHHGSYLRDSKFKEPLSYRSWQIGYWILGQLSRVFQSKVTWRYWVSIATKSWGNWMIKNSLNQESVKWFFEGKGETEKMALTSLHFESRGTFKGIPRAKYKRNAFFGFGQKWKPGSWIFYKLV